jgi:hypothetical protein
MIHNMRGARNDKKGFSAGVKVEIGAFQQSHTHEFSLSTFHECNELEIFHVETPSDENVFAAQNRTRNLPTFIFSSTTLVEHLTLTSEDRSWMNLILFCN